MINTKQTPNDITLRGVAVGMNKIPQVVALELFYMLVATTHFFKKKFKIAGFL